MNLGFSPMMSLNLSPITLPGAAKAGSTTGVQFPQALALVQAVPTSQVTPVTQVPAVTAASQDDTSVAASQQTVTESSLEQDPVEEFKKYMAMSPAEKMRYAVLADAGLTMEEYEELPPEEKEKIDAEIAQRLNDLREARELNNNATKAIAQYQMQMLNESDDDYRANPTSIFV